MGALAVLAESKCTHFPEQPFPNRTFGLEPAKTGLPSSRPVPAPKLAMWPWYSASNADCEMPRWGVAGKHHGEKVRLLKAEGVKVDAGGGRIIGSPWSGFVQVQCD